jgi:glutaredoxin
MSYAQRKELSGNRTASTVMTVAVVGGLLYAIVTGLAYNVIKKAAENTKVVDIEKHPEAASIVAHHNRGNHTVPTLVYPDGSAQTNPAIKEIRAKLASLS